MRILFRMSNTTQIKRISLSSFFAIAHAEGFDRWFKTPRGQVGSAALGTLKRLGIESDTAILPLYGDRWPKGAIARYEVIAHESFRALFF